jgi:hypothetical protein
MKIVDASTFFKTRDVLDPEGLVGISEAYEQYWLSKESPYRGKIVLGVFESQNKTIARIALLLTEDSHSGKFCFYGRCCDISASAKSQVFKSLGQWLVDNYIESLEGPIEFSSWNANRFVSYKGDCPWFPGEQIMPEYHYHDFIQAGFNSSAEYTSSLVEDLEDSIKIGLAAGVNRALNRLTIQTVYGGEIRKFIPTLHQLSCEIFADNYAYSAITLNDFKSIYEPVLDMDCAVIIASLNMQPVGLAFSYGIGDFSADNNLMSKKKTSVLKTIGVHPSARQQHIGIGISYLTHKLWLERQYQSIIHAYMKTDNASNAMSDTFAKPIREYALVQWRNAS